MQTTRSNKVISRLDWTTILIWFILMCIGIVCIYAAVYDDEAKGIFDFSRRSGMQVLWIAIACLIAVLTLVIENRFYYTFAPVLYIGVILLMLITYFFGKEVNGSKSWLSIGPASIQSVEFMKVATALMLAKVMSEHNFHLQKFSDFFKAFSVILIVMALALLQQDTGSSLVFISFIIVFYRAGLQPWIVFTCIFVVFLFIISLLVDPYLVVIFLSLLAFLLFMIITKRAKSGLIFMGVVTTITLTLFYGLPTLNVDVSLYHSLLIAHAAIIPIAIIHALWRKLSSLIVIIGLFVLSIGVSYSVDYVFDNVLKEHQRRRINDLLGIESDLQGWGYNVHQSKVAVGSGGFTGKGFLEGTQTKFNFVPEQSTDFIFCTVGEEWGFLGATVVVLLYMLLIYRIVNIAERQKKLFAKLYGYGVASILFFHVAVNIGMTIGIMPVVGIPLPFISYGGSSLWAFTMMLFILLKLDVGRYE